MRPPFARWYTSPRCIGGASEDCREKYTYDSASNRLLSMSGGTRRTYTYDAAGNVLTDGTGTYTYDGRGRMATAKVARKTTTYKVNGLGQRVSKTLPGSSTIDRFFMYDEGGHLIGEYSAAGAAIQETIYLGDQPIAVLTSTATYYVHADHLFTPRALMDTSNAMVWHWNPDAFGGGLPTGTATYNARFPGQYFDAETGLHQNWFRDYDPILGRYLQSDPIGLLGGPNTYTYVANNPISHYDSVGLCEDFAKCYDSCMQDRLGSAETFATDLAWIGLGYVAATFPAAGGVTSELALGTAESAARLATLAGGGRAGVALASAAGGFVGEAAGVALGAAAVGASSYAITTSAICAASCGMK